MTYIDWKVCPCRDCKDYRKSMGIAEPQEAPKTGKDVFKAPDRYDSRVTEEKPGMKFDSGKAPIDSLFLRYFPRAIEAVAMVSEYGARKYEVMNWLKVDNGVERYTDGLGRHKLKEHTEGPYDDGDSGLAHAAQVAWNALARLELMLKADMIENRRGNDIGPEGKPILGTARKI